MTTEPSPVAYYQRTGLLLRDDFFYVICQPAEVFYVRISYDVLCLAAMREL